MAKSKKPKMLIEMEFPCKIRVETREGMKDAVIDHPDGMFSYCYLEEDHSAIFHLSGATPLILKDGRWEIPRE